MAIISTEELQNLCMAALTKAGLKESDARITVDHFLENEMSGKASHGMVRVIEAIETIKDCGISGLRPEIEHDAGSLVRINANKALGTVAGEQATQEAVKRAKQHGIAMVGVRNYIASNGSMACYLRKIAKEGLVAIMGCNSVALVSPPAGRERMIGTNPIGICIPGRNEEDFIADLATSAYAYGKIMVHKDKNEPIPQGVLIDETGHPSTNPKDAYDGAILPLSGYKGFSLGLMVELMAGPLIGAKAIKKDLYDNDGLFIIAIDPEAMGNTAFYEEVLEALKEIKSSATAPGHDRIPLPGERSAKILKQTIKAKELDVADQTLEKIRGMTA